MTWHFQDVPFKSRVAWPMSHEYYFFSSKLVSSMLFKLLDYTIVLFPVEVIKISYVFTSMFCI